MKPNCFYFSPAQLDVLRQKYADTENADLCAEFGCRIVSVFNAAARLGLKIGMLLIKLGNNIINLYV